MTFTRFVIHDENLGYFAAKLNGYVRDISVATQYESVDEAEAAMVSVDEKIFPIEVTIVVKEAVVIEAVEDLTNLT
jgi:hypothetical protein